MSSSMNKQRSSHVDYPPPPWPPQLDARTPLPASAAAAGGHHATHFLSPTSHQIQETMRPKIYAHSDRLFAPYPSAGGGASSSSTISSSLPPPAAASPIDFTSDAEIAARLNKQFAQEARLAQEASDARLAAELASGGTDEDAKLNSAEHIARLNLARALDREAEAKVANVDGSQVSYRNQLKAEIRARKQKNVQSSHGKKRTPETAQAKSLLRSARSARRAAIHERDLRLESERMHEHGTSTGEGNQWALLEGMIEPSASEEESSDEYDEDGDEEDGGHDSSAGRNDDRADGSSAADLSARTTENHAINTTTPIRPAAAAVAHTNSHAGASSSAVSSSLAGSSVGVRVVPAVRSSGVAGVTASTDHSGTAPSAPPSSKSSFTDSHPASSPAAPSSSAAALLNLNHDSDDEHDSDIEIIDRPTSSTATKSAVSTPAAASKPISFYSSTSLAPVDAFNTPGTNSYRSPLTYGTPKPRPNSVPPKNASSTKGSKASSSVPPSPALGGASGDASSSGLYLPPPDPALIDPFASESQSRKRTHEYAAGPASAAAPSSKKQKKRDRAAAALAQRQQALLNNTGASYASVVAASNDAALAVAASARSKPNKHAIYAGKHGKAVTGPTDATPFDPAICYTSDELTGIVSDWSGVRHVILLDLDNWSGFFRRLPYEFNDDVYLWVFYGKNTHPRITRTNRSFNRLRDLGHIQFTRCGERPDAADFALMLKLGELNQLCAKSIPFTLFSGDRGFDETLLHISDRRVQRVDPHHAGTDEETFALLKSIADT